MLESKSGVPLYRQLKQVLTKRIAQGDWKPGDLFPSEKSLESEFKVSRTTVRLALKDLDYEGLISRQPGRGTFVAEPKLQHSPGQRGALGDALDRLGKSASWVFLEAGLSPVPEDVAKALDVDSGTVLFRTQRLRVVDGVKLGYLTSYVAPGIPIAADKTSLTQGDSLSYLDGSGLLNDGMASRCVDAIYASVAVARHLAIEPGAPVLRIRRLITSASGQPVEFLVAQYRGDRFEYTLPSTQVHGR
jgi:GntR family transcriptional regulator